jgi:hypothetical protein
MRGMIFTGNHVLKVIAGTKMQSRRLISPALDESPLPGGCQLPRNPFEGEDGIWRWMRGKVSYSEDDRKVRYHRGEVLYCKETWTDETPDGKVWYRASRFRMRPSSKEGPLRWKSSMFMPEWASRCQIKIVDLKVERLQDISEADALAEGCKPEMAGADSGGLEGMHWTARKVYLELWNRINPKHPSENNPWVVAYSFEVEK